MTTYGQTHLSMIIVEFDFETPVLRHALRTVPEMSVAHEVIHASDTEHIRLLHWAWSGDFEAFEAALTDDPVVLDWRRLTRADHRNLYRIEYSEFGEEVTIYPTWVELDAQLLAATGTHDGWSARMRFPDRQAVAELRDACEAKGLTFDVRSLYSKQDADGTPFGLTPSQREALEQAVATGYFSIPRESSLADLADALNVSGQAASERLRRGMRTLVTHAFDEMEATSPVENQ